MSFWKALDEPPPESVRYRYKEGDGCILKSERRTALGMLYTYDGHNSRLSIRKLSDGGAPVYKLEHKDAINAPNALFSVVDGAAYLMLDFHNLCVPADTWAKVKTAADEMLQLWQEYCESEDSVY